MSGDCCSLSSTELLVSFLPSPFRPSKTEYWSRKDVRRIGGRCARWSLSHFCTTCESGFSVILSSDMGTAFHRPPSKTASNQWWTPPFCLSLASFIALTSLCIHCSVSCGLKTLIRSHFQTANPPPFVSSQITLLSVIVTCPQYTAGLRGALCTSPCVSLLSFSVSLLLY